MRYEDKKDKSFLQFLNDWSNYTIGILFPFFASFPFYGGNWQGLADNHWAVPYAWVAFFLLIPTIWFLDRYKTWKELYPKQ